MVTVRPLAVAAVGRAVSMLRCAPGPPTTAR